VISNGEKSKGKDYHHIDKIDNYYEFYDNYDDNFDGQDIRQRRILKKTLNFFKYIKESETNETDLFIIRTNLSTFVDIPKFIEWMSNLKNYKALFGGPIIDSYEEYYTQLSGTFLVLSRNIVDEILINEQILWTTLEINKKNNTLRYNTREPLYLKSYPEDDTLLSLIIRSSKTKNIGWIKKNEIDLVGIPRLDFIEVESLKLDSCIVYSKCDPNKESIFLYRFKTKNRDNDIIQMKDLLENIYIDDYNIIEYVNSISSKLNIKIILDKSVYSNVFNKPFKINSIIRGLFNV
jgi:hypothetical protein